MCFISASSRVHRRLALLELKMEILPGNQNSLHFQHLPAVDLERSTCKTWKLEIASNWRLKMKGAKRHAFTSDAWIVLEKVILVKGVLRRSSLKIKNVNEHAFEDSSIDGKINNIRPVRTLGLTCRSWYEKNRRRYNIRSPFIAGVGPLLDRPPTVFH